MKIRFATVFLAAFLLVGTVAARAQSADSTRTAEGRANQLTERMKTELSLTEEQYPKVQAINLRHAQKNEAIFQGTGARFAKFRSLKSSQKDKSKEMKSVLTSDQYKKYEQMMEEMKNKARQQYQSRGQSAG
ncbi:hypothetical protein ACQ86N_12895 [Puia sp. P3]|uniref:hypothetical protein n=1 Tax=Puia sp. P3 TaxID=3423952 RepID=UPI003D66A33A